MTFIAIEHWQNEEKKTQSTKPSTLFHFVKYQRRSLFIGLFFNFYYFMQNQTYKLECFYPSTESAFRLFYYIFYLFIQNEIHRTKRISDQNWILCMRNTNTNAHHKIPVVVENQM